MVAHRRAGKTVACVNELIARAVYSKKKRPVYAYIGPQLKQAKKVAWEYLKEYTAGLVDKVSESELYVRLAHNGAVINIYGADNPDSFRGQYFDGVVLDEYADMHPGVWSSVLVPALSDRKGWAVFIGTPKGKNHFWKIWDKAKNQDNWWRFILRASESRILSEEELQIARGEMTDSEYQREYECDFDAAVPGTYYADIIAALERAGRISLSAEYDPEFPTSTVADLGKSDSCSWWFWQDKPDGIAILDCYEEQGKDLDHYFEMLDSKPYKFDALWLPHDARQKTLATKRSTAEQFMDRDEHDLFRKFTPGERILRLVPNLSIQSGIDATRKVLKDCWFNPRCDKGLDALKYYHREWNEEMKVFAEKPAHDWSSHYADAFRYLCIVAKQRTIALPESQRPTPVPPQPKITLQQLWDDRDRALALNRGRGNW